VFPIQSNDFLFAIIFTEYPQSANWHHTFEQPTGSYIVKCKKMQTAQLVLGAMLVVD
jgi:hypothetical protein